LIRWAAPIVEEMELHFYVPVDAFGCCQLGEPNIMGRCPSEVDDHGVAPSVAAEFLRLVPLRCRPPILDLAGMP
jgi:hypothetical protein